MKTIIKHLWLSVILIMVASLILLLSDMDQHSAHKQQEKSSYPVIAVMQNASTRVLESHVDGVLNRLQERGYVAPQRANIRLYNAQGDYSVATAIAQEIVAGQSDIVITSSTISLQTVARANALGTKVQVFGAVTDPYVSGVGISGPEADQHPPHLVGVGTFQPVENTFRIAKQMNPALKRVGTMWNPGEQCSEACLKKARRICAQLGIELVEVNAGNTSEAPEALRSLIGKGIEAIWIGGDTVAMSSVDLIVKQAAIAQIAAFSNSPDDVKRGLLFGLGADYFQVGEYTADVAIDILKGADPAKLRIDNVIPEQLVVNRDALLQLSDNWKLTPALEQRLAMADSCNKDSVTLKPEEGKSYRIALNYIVPAPIFDYAIAGFRDELQHLGFIEGENLELTMQHANGDMSFLPQSITSLLHSDPDLLVVMSTPSLSSAIAHTDGVDIAFGLVSAPLQAGAGESFEHHLPQVTGIAQKLPSAELFAWVKRLFPQAQTIGALYNPSEANSAKEIIDLKKILQRQGMELHQVAVYSTSEVPEAIGSLLSRGVDLVFSMADNTVANGMPAMVKACRQQDVPIIAEDISLMGSGALLSCAPGPYTDGQALARLSARLLLGESAAHIPITYAKTHELTLDLAAMQRAGVTPSSALLQRANRFFNFSANRERPAKLVVVNLVENASLTNAMDGLMAGMHEMGLQQGRDYTMKHFNAQGDMSQVMQILDQAAQEQPDVLITLTTPVFIAAAKKNYAFPVVFTVASDPAKLGLFAQGCPQNITGIHDDPPVAKVLEMARKYVPDLSAVGIVYNPAQMNALISVEKLRSAGQDQQIEVIESTVATASDLPMATQALIQRGADAIIVSTDNLAITGFAAIHKVAKGADVPIFTTDIALVAKGADGGIGESYYDWGRESGHQVVRVLAGVSPAEMPISATKSYARLDPELPQGKATLSLRNNGSREPLQLRCVLYSETEFAERCLEGYLAGIAAAGLVEGRDYELRVLNAQGDMSTLSSIMTSVKSDHVDLLMVVSTPTLQAALRLAGDDTPIVFTGVGDGVLAGAGKSETEHLANVTGITTRSPFGEMASLIHQTLPQARRVGTLFTPGEINSVLYKDWFKEALEAQGLELEAVPVSTSADVAQAAAQLCSRDIDVVAQIVDNMTRPGFALIARKATENAVPTYVFDSDQMKDGGVICLSRDYYDAGIEAAQKALRVLRGTSPAEIPFHNTRSEKLLINRSLAQKYNIKLTTRLQEEALVFNRDSGVSQEENNQ
ncbi:MAG: ABC transporter substrate-binding protein [Desulfuromonas sp.]|nr:ABC transporter substrate-binding protein [Desulfuromonas sp.]